MGGVHNEILLHESRYIWTHEWTSFQPKIPIVDASTAELRTFSPPPTSPSCKTVNCHVSIVCLLDEA
jgi:hypothetical protein